MFLAGVHPRSGATLAGVIRATGAGVATVAPHDRCAPDRRPRDARPATAAVRAVTFEEPEPLLPPEPETAELVIRATHVEAPPIEDSIDDSLDDEEIVEVAARGRDAEPERGRRGPRPSSPRRAATAHRSPTTPTSSGRFRRRAS